MSLTSRITIDTSEPTEIICVDYTGLVGLELVELMSLSKKEIEKQELGSVSLLEIVRNVNLEGISLEDINEHVVAISKYLRRYAVVGGLPAIALDHLTEEGIPIQHFDSKIEAVGYLIT